VEVLKIQKRLPITIDELITRIRGVEAYTINDHHDGVPEVAYLVETDGVVMYHSGDYVGRYAHLGNIE